MLWYEGLFEIIEEQKNAEMSVKMSAYMQNRFEFLGIPRRELKQLTKPYMIKAKKLDFDRDFVFLCWNKPYREAQYVGTEYILRYQSKLSQTDIESLKTLITEKSWWETADSLDSVVGGMVQRFPELKETMLLWSQSENIWLRRVAIDFQQSFKTLTDTKLLEQIISNNFGSGEFFIDKAIGWSLREYSKTDAAWVVDFLNKYRNKLSALSMREANKLLK